MKKRLKILVLAVLFAGVSPLTTRAQSLTDCIEQLILDYQKLAGLRGILSQMYSGYEVLHQGYGAVKNVSQGNFSLHQAFLDGLLRVSPAVRKYSRVADIISDQANLFSEYKNAAKRLAGSGRFSPEELRYVTAVYDQLANASLKNLNKLSMVMGDSQLRMSDAERLAAVDRIYLDSRSQLSYLRKFNDQAGQMILLREKAARDKQTINSLYGINP